MEGHTFKLCELEPKGLGERGRHRRTVLFHLHGRSDEQIKALMAQIAPQLQPNQVIEVDAKIAARGSSVHADYEADAHADTPAPPQTPLDDGDDEEADDAEVVANPVQATRFSIRMLWEAQKRHAAASEELCRRTSALTDKAIEQMKKVDDALTEVSSMRRALLKERQELTGGQGGVQTGITAEDIVELMKTGAAMLRDLSTQGRGGSSPER